MKGWFPYDRFDRYNRSDRWKKRSAIVAIMWKPLLAILAVTAIIWKPAYIEAAQRLKSQRPFNFFGSGRSDHMETSLTKMMATVNTLYTAGA